MELNVFCLSNFQSLIPRIPKSLNFYIPKFQNYNVFLKDARFLN